MYTQNKNPSESKFSFESLIDDTVPLEGSDYKCLIVEEYDLFPTFVDIGNHQFIESKKIDDIEISLIPGKTTDGSIRYPVYKLEYDVFWALRALSNNSVKFNFSIKHLQNILSKSGKITFSYVIQKSLEILLTAKFQVKNAKGEVREYRYIKELRMPTRTSKGYVAFDDSFAEAFESGKCRSINVSKLLNHTTAGGRWLYQRINMNFTQASESINTYNLSFNKIIRDLHRKSEKTKHTFEYLKTVARDLRKNGSIDITDEEIKTYFSAKATKYSPMLYFPLTSDFISDIHKSNGIAKAKRARKAELDAYVAQHGTSVGHVFSGDINKKKYKKKAPSIPDLSKTSIPIEQISEEPIQSTHTVMNHKHIDSNNTDMPICESISSAIQSGPVDQQQKGLISNSPPMIPLSWKPAIEIFNHFINKTDRLDTVIYDFICRHQAKGIAYSEPILNSRFIHFVERHLEIMKEATRYKPRTLEEELNDSSWCDGKPLLDSL